MHEHKKDMNSELIARVPGGVVEYHTCQHCKMSTFTVFKDGKVYPGEWGDHSLEGVTLADLMPVIKRKRKRRQAVKAGATMPKTVPAPTPVDAAGQIALF